ncbi:MAG: dephospho-CoA kinase [Vampirovibrionales bacterium]|nr:dephospho-CoA kinase [Vampirovibrionales bacterium]
MTQPVVQPAASATAPLTVKRISLTGGIACGKSVVREILDSYNVPVIDADELTAEVYQRDEELKANIRDAFGADVFGDDGQVDRKKLGNRVFSDTASLQRLAGWIHPKVAPQIQSFFESHNDQKLAVAVIPVLFEYGLEDEYDEIWVVKATRDQQIVRLMTHRGFNREEAEARINIQLPLPSKVVQADFVIDNSGALAQTRQQVQKKLQQMGW